MTKALSTYWFNFLTSRYLIYNTCWEDPEIDRFLLDINSDSSIFTITSAADNVLAYLLDEPATIDCVDLNPYQNALLELKIALFKLESPDYLQSLFLEGKSKDYQHIYKLVRPNLLELSVAYWDKKIKWFSPNDGFYSKALTGKFALLLNTILKVKGIKSQVDSLFKEPDLNRRKQIFKDVIEPKLWSGIGNLLWKSNAMLALAGIPSNQKLAISDLEEFLKQTLYNLFVLQNPANNHFWRLYILGNYTSDYSPLYLKSEHFESIHNQVHKIDNHVLSVTDYLKQSTKFYSHFILLDHQDWLVNNGTKELEYEWQLILEKAKPNAKVLMRSVHQDLSFLPDFVQKSVTSIPIDYQYLVHNDKVGTYPSTFLFKLNV